MPSVSLPVLAIKEANEHLQALFQENQRLDTQVDELTNALKKVQEENTTLGDYVNSVNQQVLTLGQEHIEALNALRESLNAEKKRQIEGIQRSHTVELESINAQREREISDLQTSHTIKLAEQAEAMKAEEEKRLNDLQEKLKSEERNRITDLQVKLKSEEKKKVNALQTSLDEVRAKVTQLEEKLSAMNAHLRKNTLQREENIALLNNVFKTTMKSMSACLNITKEEDFIRADNFVREQQQSIDISDDHENGGVDVDDEEEEDSGFSSNSASSLSEVSVNDSDVSMKNIANGVDKLVTSCSSEVVVLNGDGVHDNEHVDHDLK